MNKKLWTLLAVLIAFMLVLGACNNDEESSGSNTEGTTEPAKTEEDKDKEEDKEEEPAAEEGTSEFSQKVEHEGDAIDGGILKVALGTDTPLKGSSL